MKGWRRVCAAGALVGALGGLLTPLCPALEERLGLHVLFHLRGPRPPPGEVCLVRMDRASARALDLPPDPSHWPRNAHARLLEHLKADQPAAIVFDVFFGAPRGTDEDAALEQALATTGHHVVLCAYSDMERMRLDAGHSAVVERVTPPFERFARHAAMVAPFPLPRVPARVSRFWTFCDDQGCLPTLPVAAYLCYVHAQAPAAWQEFSASHATGAPLSFGSAAVAQRQQALLTGAPATDDPPGPAPAAARLRSICNGPATRLLNFYGPDGTIPSRRYSDVLTGATPATDYAGKVVFVGFSDPDVPTRKDGFETVFTNHDGQMLSGMEIAATAFANLLDGSALRPLAPAHAILLTLAWGVLQGALCRALPTAAAAAAALLGTTAYLGAATTAFAQAFLWMPVAVPALILPAVAFVGALMDRNAVAAAERRAIQATAGLYLPPAVVARLSESARGLGGAGTDQKVVHGTCMITDATNYTPLSETLEPDELGRVMNRYFEAAFRPVREQGGVVMNLTGDSILAVWLAAPPALAPSPNVCAAALGVAAGIREFNRHTPAVKLPTRIGIHYGPILMGSMGALDHFEYVPIGDTVNTAARLEALNKLLKTELLISTEALPAAGGFFTRQLGTFRFAGKTRPLSACELLGREAAAGPEARRHREVFEEGIAAFAQGDWGLAGARFRQVLDGNADDGPASFYLAQCETFATQPPAGWTGVLTVGKNA